MLLRQFGALGSHYGTPKRRYAMAPRREGGAWVKKTVAGEKSKEEEANFKGRGSAFEAFR